MNNDSQVYLRCADCGEYVNESEAGAHRCSPAKTATRLSPTAFEAAVNSVRIAIELPDDALGIEGLGFVDAVAYSAERLAAIESVSAGFWNDTVLDWETVCARIAQHIANTGKAATKGWINRMMRGET